MHVQVGGVDKKITKANAGIGSGSGGGTSEHNPIWVAGGFDYPPTDPGVLETLTLTNGTLKQQAFDDTTNQKDLQAFKVPSDIDTAGNVTFRLIGKTETVTTNDIVFNLNHSIANDNEDPDQAFTTESSGAKAVNGSGKLDIIEWTESVANLGWSANDYCRIELERDASNVSDTVVGNYNPLIFEIDIDRA